MQPPTFSWKDFCSHVEKTIQLPILSTLLKKTQLVEKKDNNYIISCPNPGVRFYLETKKALLQQALSQMTEESAIIVFVIVSKTKKSVKKILPLEDFKKKKDETLKKTGAHNKYVFENFAVSSSNQIAYAAATSVAEHPSTSYNPLFIYGGVGVGKTHLSHAIINRVLEHDSQKNVLFCSSEEFTNDLVERIREKNTKGFRNKYRGLDVLVIDDIQFIAGKTYIQEEFYHTFNTLVKNGGQIVLTSDKPPHEISKLEDRLRSRFAGGLIIDVQKPDYELRAAIVLIKARERNIEIDTSTARRIAEKTQDARELEGRLLSLYTKSIENDKNINMVLESEVEELNNHTKNTVTSHDVIKAVCSYYNITPSHIKKPTRKEGVVLPRQIIMYILRSSLGLKLEDIAFLLKRKDHTTIMHGVDKITGLMIKDPSIKEEVDRIVKSLVI